MNPNTFVFNGINGTSGEYLFPGLTAEEIVQIAKSEQWDRTYLNELRAYYQHLTEPCYCPKEQIDPKNLAETGWGVIFAYDVDPAIREALSPLLEHRKAQAGGRYREFSGANGYRYDVAGNVFESKQDFLFRHKVVPIHVCPERMPCYLLIVGDPQTIPYQFQSELGLGYAVGRIHFDSPEDYAFYARSVVASEQNPRTLPRQAAFFAVHNPNDPVTASRSEYFMKPLAEKAREELPDWAISTFFEEYATKAQLQQVLGGEQTPALFVASGHGIGFPDGDPRQRSHQGALLCQDWPGPKDWQGATSKAFYFAADDIEEQARLLGTIILLFASYSAGMPRTDHAPSFLGNLPKRLLCHPKGGALAVVGQLNRIWGAEPGADQSLYRGAVFQEVLFRLMKDEPVGSAFAHIALSYAELTQHLTETLEHAKFGISIEALTLAKTWLAVKEMGSYVITGDPAARLSTNIEGTD